MTLAHITHPLALFPTLPTLPAHLAPPAPLPSIPRGTLSLSGAQPPVDSKVSSDLVFSLISANSWSLVEMKLEKRRSVYFDLTGDSDEENSDSSYYPSSSSSSDTFTSSSSSSSSSSRISSPSVDRPTLDRTPPRRSVSVIDLTLDSDTEQGSGPVVIDLTADDDDESSISRVSSTLGDRTDDSETGGRASGSVA